MHSSYFGRFFLSSLLFTIFAVMHLFQPFTAARAEEEQTPIYVGSLACKKCHAHEYGNFVSYAKKSHSFQSIERLRKGLSPKEIVQCYSCHTTGYGKPGGFVSLEKTPHLKNAGCEVCHGPGGEHSRNPDTGFIKLKLHKEDCEECHISERVKAFRFKPLIHGGAH